MIAEVKDTQAIVLKEQRTCVANDMISYIKYAGLQAKVIHFCSSAWNLGQKPIRGLSPIDDLFQMQSLDLSKCLLTLTMATA